jgi:hypothetical protein
MRLHRLELDVHDAAAHPGSVLPAIGAELRNLRELTVLFDDRVDLTAAD